MSGSNDSYTGRLQVVYDKMVNSRVVNKRETDDEALNHFQQLCNETLPKNIYEVEFRNAIKNMYYTNRTSFDACVTSTPYLRLITEARSIVLHFGIDMIIYIKWIESQNQYEVLKNNKQFAPNYYNSYKKKFVPRPHNMGPKQKHHHDVSRDVKHDIKHEKQTQNNDLLKLEERIAKLELSSLLEKIEPDEETNTTESTNTTEPTKNLPNTAAPVRWDE